jgi:hypothetical protein
MKPFTSSSSSSSNGSISIRIGRHDRRLGARDFYEVRLGGTERRRGAVRRDKVALVLVKGKVR